MITVRSTINLAHQSVPNVIPAVQGDTGRSILFSLADFTIPTGATARYFITKPSGLAVYNDATIDGNTVLIDLTAQSLAEYGDCPGQVRISVGDTVVTSFEFILHVEPFRGIDAVESSTETNIFDKAVDDAREAIAEAAEEAEEYISQALDTTLTIPDKAADAKATGDAISDSADAVIAQMRAEIADVYPTETAQGNPATFDDGADNIPVKDLKVSIVPTQDLHGYDKPWPGGGGKNIALYDRDGGYSIYGITFTPERDSAGNCVAIKATGTSNGYAMCSGSVFTLKPGTYRFCDFGSAVEGSGSNYSRSVLMYSDNHDAVALAYNSTGETFTTTGDISVYVRLDITNGRTVDGTFQPMLCLESQFDGTFSPYSNLCPISGYESVDVVRTGKNLLNVTAQSQTVNGVTFTVHDDGSITANGTATANAVFCLNGSFSISDNQEYIYSGLTGGSTTTYRMECYWRGVGGTNKGSEVLVSGEKTICVSDKADAVKIDTFIIVVLSGATVNNVLFKPMVRLASDPAGFEPYHTPQTVTTDLGRTVYGGTLDVTTGVLTVDKASVDLGTLTWTYASQYSFFTAGLSGIKLSSAGTKIDGICSMYPVLSYEWYSAYGSRDNVIWVHPADEFIIIKDTSKGTDAATFKTAMSGVQFVYPLATPQTYQLTPQELLSVLGTNHISTDAESVEVVYRADIALYIAKLLPSGVTLSMARPMLATPLMQTPIEPEVEEEPEEELEEETMEEPTEE